MLDGIIAEVKKTMNDLRKNSQRFNMDQKECTHCKNLKSLSTKKCHQYFNIEFYTLYCDADFKLCDFIDDLEFAGAWPLSRRRKNSATKFLFVIKSALSQAYHHFFKGIECPLIKRLELLKRLLESTLKQSYSVDFKFYRFESLV